MRMIFSLVLFFSQAALATPNLNPELVHAWNKFEKEKFPSPLAAIFSNSGKTLAFVGDKHSDQVETSKFIQAALAQTAPQIIVVEGLEYSRGKNPKGWLKKN